MMKPEELQGREVRSEFLGMDEETFEIIFEYDSEQTCR